MKTKKKNIYYSILVFIILEAVLNLNVYYNKQANISSSVETQNSFIDRNFDASIAAYRNFSESIYDNIINRPEILKLVYDIENSSTPDVYRLELKSKLDYIYSIIKYKNFRIFHFHDKNGTSLLRFHKPEKYGDDLRKFRSSIANISKNHNYTEGFEEGRILNSYRYIFPLIYNEEYIGSVEISISIYDFLKEIEKIFNGTVDFLLMDSVINRIVNADTRKLYSPTPFNGYSCYAIFDSEDTITRALFTNNELDILNKKTSKIFDEKKSSGKSFYKLLKQNNQSILVSFIPLQNISGQQVAFIVYRQLFVSADEIRKNYLIMLLIGNIIISIISFLSFFVISSRQMAIEQQQVVQLAKEKAEEVSRLKSDFLANMSHEIRTPMNGVVGMVEILKNTDVNKQQAEYLTIIDNSANNLLTVINDILDFSKIESDKIILENIPFSIRKVIDEVGDTVFLKAEKQGISFITYTDTNMPEFVFGDPIRLRQVVLNFVNNAIKFTNKGKVYVGAEIVKETNNKVKVNIIIEDTGLGISDEAQKTLFESFTQADASITRKYGGTGLGLTISKKLVNLMKGKVNVSSELGKGSVFTCTIEFYKAPIVAENHNLHKQDLSHLRVLIVDDNKDNQLIFSKYLDIWNIKSSLAINVDEAIEMMSKAIKKGMCYDIALVDFHMPRKTGFDFASIIKKKKLLKNTKLILLSSISDMFSSSQIKKAGFATFLYKPIKLGQFQDAIFKVAEQEIAEKVKEGELEGQPSVIVKNLKILLVEDNIINQKVATIALQQIGYKADVANDGEVAVKMFSENSYDLILMDIQMPILDGIGATKKIRNIEKVKADGSRIFIVAITANAMKKDVELYLNSGMDDVILKPFKQNELSELLNNIVI